MNNYWLPLVPMIAGKFVFETFIEKLEILSLIQ